jgi:hypothetical protein
MLSVSNKIFIIVNHMKKKKIIIISSVLAVLAIGFAVWYFVINKPQTTTTNTNNNGFNQGNRAFSLIEGTIADITDNTIIVTQSNGSGQKIVKVTSRTQILDTISVDKDDVLKVGNTITARGTDGTDTYMATEVTKSDLLQDSNQVRPTFGQGSGPNGSGNRSGRQDQSGNSRPTGFNVAIIGKITNIDGNLVTISTIQNTTKVIDISKAVFRKTKLIALTNLQISDKISVNGNDLSAGIEARTITRTK